VPFSGAGSILISPWRKKVKLNKHPLLVFLALSLLALCMGCSDRDPSSLEMARATIDPLVFEDDLDGDVYFQAFMGTYDEAVTMDSIYANNGSASMKITVPGEGSALGDYAGGVLTSVGVRDMADFNCLTFYARSDVNCALNVAGFGNDNTGNSLYEAGRANVPLNTDWQFVVVPIPSSSKIIAERGLFTFAEGWENLNPMGHQIWIDDISFANLGNITNPRPAMPTVTKQYFVGSTANLGGTYTTFDIDGADVVVDHMPGYFDFQSSDSAIATVEDGKVKVVGVGNASVSAELDGVAVDGLVSISGYVPPGTTASNPTVPAADVISMFSDSYNDVPVTSWNTHWQWSTAENDEYMVEGNNTIMYSFLNFVGIDFTGQTIDASAMTHLHMDVFAPEGTNFLVKVVAFNGDNGLWTGEAELAFDAASTPAFAAGQWSTLEIPLADFNLGTSWGHIGQMVLSTDDAQLLLVDNIYWHK
jgi:hypothetical protein